MFRIPKTTMPVTTTATKKPKQTQSCVYASYECTQPCLEGYNYCGKHILEDKDAPFKQCGFIYNTNGRKCQQAAPKLDRRDISYVLRLNSVNSFSTATLGFYAEVYFQQVLRRTHQKSSNSTYKVDVSTFFTTNT